MAEPKPLASLSAGLLARKGAARPAMRRQVHLPGGDMSQLDDLGWNDMGYVVDPQDDGSASAESAAHNATVHCLSPMVAPQDNDDGIARDLDAAADRASAPVVSEPEVRLQQQALEASMAAQSAPVVVAPRPVASAPTTKSTRRARAGAKGSFAFTLRLDPERHLRLRIASATNNVSTQQILIGLVDDYLTSLPEIDAFAAQLPASNRQANR